MAGHLKKTRQALHLRATLAICSDLLKLLITKCGALFKAGDGSLAAHAFQNAYHGVEYTGGAPNVSIYIHTGPITTTSFMVAS